jgi:hypothetical protein
MAALFRDPEPSLNLGWLTERSSDFNVMAPR